MRVSATDIDSLRYYRDDEDMELATIIARLRKQEPPTEAMQIGTAFHNALENSTDGDFSELEAEGYRFLLECDGVLDLPDIRELKATREYIIDDISVTLVGKVDALLAKRIDDHKFTSRFDPERFLASYQWRIYLEIFGADLFRWNVFEGRQIEPGVIAISAFHTLECPRYPGMGDDVERELRRFVEFARVHLPERFIAPVAEAA